MDLPASYPTKVAQKDAIYGLDRRYGQIRKMIQNLFLEGDRTDEAKSNFYYDLPYGIGHLRDKHADTVVTLYPTLADAAKELKELVASYKAVKAIPVIKLPSATTLRKRALEVVIRDRGENDTLKVELLKKAPMIAKEFAAHIHTLYETRNEMKLDSEGLVMLRSFVYIPGNEKLDYFKRLSLYSKEGLAACKLNKKALEKGAKEYGERIALAWYEKLAFKLGASPKIATAEDEGWGSVEVEGIIDGKKVQIHQSIVAKRSKYGRFFHQFPARIYVNNVFVTEHEFAKLFHKEFKTA